MRVIPVTRATIDRIEVDRISTPEPGARPIESFDDFYRREFHSVVGLGRVLSGSYHVAEDLAQHAFTQAHRNWRRVGGFDDPGAWVRRVLVNASTSRFRRLASETKAVARLAGRRDDPVPGADSSEEIWSAVRRLPRRQAQVIALRYWDDLPVAQIATVLECSPETVKTHLKRGRAALAVTLELEESFDD